MVCQSVPCQMAEPTPPINLEELDTGANKVLMFNPQENGPARAGVKGRRRDDLFDANKFFFSNVSNPTNGQSQAKMRHNRQNLSGPIGSDLLLSFDLLPELQPFSLPIVDSLSGKEILHTICNLTVDLNFRKLQRLWQIKEHHIILWTKWTII